jgi:hypothetical protein
VVVLGFSEGAGLICEGEGLGEVLELELLLQPHIVHHHPAAAELFTQRLQGRALERRGALLARDAFFLGEGLDSFHGASWG